jgi:predicted ATPase
LETVRLKGLEADGTNVGFGIASDVMPIGYTFKEIKVIEKETFISGL